MDNTLLVIIGILTLAIGCLMVLIAFQKSLIKAQQEEIERLKSRPKLPDFGMMMAMSGVTNIMSDFLKDRVTYKPKSTFNVEDLPNMSLENLKEKLEELLESEDFENAALVRDQIKNLQS